MLRHLIVCLFILLLVCGCSTYGARPESIRPESNLKPIPIVKPTFSQGSLWPGESTRNSLFADNKARYVNDIVTIVVDESSSGQNKASTNTSNNTTTDAGISAYDVMTVTPPRAATPECLPAGVERSRRGPCVPASRT